VIVSFKMTFIVLLFTLLFISTLNTATISGISSGGYMAVQLHVAYSSKITGAAIIAGGPYWCANNNIAVALSACASQPELIVVSELISATAFAFSTFSIDNPNYLHNSSIWLFSGILDTVVRSGVVEKLEEYYKYFVNPKNIATVYNISAEHAMPTNKYGNKCNYLGSPFINNCDYDTAGYLLQYLYGPLKPATKYNPANLIKIHQAVYIPGYPLVSPWLVGLNDYAYAYIPSYCSGGQNKCRLHIALHGCKQTIGFVKDTFYTQSGYNEWAEANNIIILYPQAHTNIANPQGCWDWWGYTGADYATKLGIQMATINNMLKKYE